MRKQLLNKASYRSLAIIGAIGLTTSIMQGCVLAPLAAGIGTGVAVGGGQNVEDSVLLKRASFALSIDESKLTIKDKSEDGMRTNFVAVSSTGKSYRCYVVGGSTAMRVMTFGSASASDAICSGVDDKGESPMKNSCNALLKAAGKC